MKKTFFRMLPFVAAVVLAASCGKDGDSDVNISEPEPIATPDHTEATVADGFVEIPFSIKVNDGKSLSKVTLNENKAINFEPKDVETVKLSVAGKTVTGISGTLDLSKDDGGNYSFSGNITVPEGQEGAFSTGGGIDLVGTFKLNESSITNSSATSFKDLWDKCSHEFRAEFKSTASSLTLVDQNLYFYVATYKSTISINDKAVTSENGFTKGSYYAYEYANTAVTDNGSAKSIAPSKLYTIGKAVTSVTLSSTSASVEVGKNVTLTATVAPTEATNPSVTWTTSDASIATVSNGVVTGVAAGTATITATSDGQSATCTVTVVQKPTSVTINNAPSSKVWGNDAFTLTASVEPSGVTNPDVTWTVTQGSATLTPSGDNNSSCSVLITGNTEDIKIRATVDELVSEVTIVVDKDYVDFGIKDAKGKTVYWAQNNLYDEKKWTELTDMEKEQLPTKADFEALVKACYWVWGQKDGTNGMYAYKLRKGQSSNYNGSSFNNESGYSPSTDPLYIFLPVTPGRSGGRYWSSTESELRTDYECCLYFCSLYVDPESNDSKTPNPWSVRTVRRSN